MGWFDELKSFGQQQNSQGSGRGVIDFRFNTIKTGGFKLWLFFYLVGQAKSSNNELPWTVRETGDGIRLFIGGQGEGQQEYDGVLDFRWGEDPSPFFAVDRFDPDEARPYPGELLALNKVVDAMTDVYSEPNVTEDQRLFTFQDGQVTQLAAAKAKLADMAAAAARGGK